MPEGGGNTSSRKVRICLPIALHLVEGAVRFRFNGLCAVTADVDLVAGILIVACSRGIDVNHIIRQNTLQLALAEPRYASPTGLVAPALVALWVLVGVATAGQNFQLPPFERRAYSDN